MQVIVILPIKNEGWILEDTLKNFSAFADHIILADQKSYDNTKEICAKWPKAKVIDNPYIGYTNEIRFMLLDEARKIPGNNLILQLDADEFINPAMVNEMRKVASQSDKVISFAANWLQIYEGASDKKLYYRNDGPWKNNLKHFAFFDDRTVDYDRSTITDEHVNRIPNISRVHKLQLSILHLQFLAQKRCEIKQALYMCNELVKGFNPRITNNRYSITKYIKNMKLLPLMPEWLQDVDLPPMDIFKTYDATKIDDMFELFNQKGALFFEPLDIWDTPELKDRFSQEVGRSPSKVKIFPKWLVFANNFKNKIKNHSW